MSTLLLALLCSALLIHQANLAIAPSFFADHTSDEHVRRVSLHAPLRSGTLQQFITRQEKRAGALLRRADVPSNTSESSSNNPNDKSQSLGFLGDSFYAPLNISTDPPQMVFVEIDTGSSDLWVVSSTCTSEECRDERILKFDESKSSTFHTVQINSSVTITNAPNDTQTKSVPSRRKVLAAEPDNTTALFNVLYQDQSSATGILGLDTVSLADLSAPKQIFGLVSETNLTLSKQGISGVLGMGFARGSAIARTLRNGTTDGTISPLLTSILSTSNESYPLFSLTLNRLGGNLTLGAADASILPDKESRRQVEWHDVVPLPSGNSQSENSTQNQEADLLGQYVYWLIRMSAAGFNGSSVDVSPTYTQVGSRPLALIDSGTAGIIGPSAAVGAMFNQVSGARHVGDGRYVVPCTTQERMFFSFSGRNYTLLPSDYIIGPATGNPYLCLAWPLAVQGSADGVDWILGQSFLRAQYTLFSLGIDDTEAPKIGFYPLRSDANATSPASVFALQPSQEVASFVSEMTPVATTLPNSLVPQTTYSSSPSYLFANATFTPSAGVLPTSARNNKVPPSTYRPILSAMTGDGDLQVLASDSPALPLPSNPAQDTNQAFFLTASRRTAVGVLWSAILLLF